MSNYAYYCLHELKITPRQFDEMDIREKAFIIASIELKMKSDKEQAKKAKRKR